MSGIFVNYRTADGPHGAAALYELLGGIFGTTNVFRDCASMDPIDHYPSAISQALEEADVLLSVVGKNWFATDADNRRLVDRPRDWVRTEIARAFELGIPVVPVLLDDVPEPRKAQLPDDIGSFGHQQGFRVRHQTLGRDVRTLGQALIDALPALRTAWFSPVTPRLVDDPAPGELLRAEHDIVPFFTGRQAELDQLLNWCDGTQGATVCVVTGGGGTGKTRLVRELSERLREKKWYTGVLGDVDIPAAARSFQLGVPTLAVIDYVEARPGNAAALAASMDKAAHTASAPHRLILIARSLGEWWSSLLETADDRASRMFARAMHLPLAPALLERSAWEEERRRAAEAFAARLGVASPTGLARSAVRLSLGDGSWELLEAHAMALADVLDSMGGKDDDDTGAEEPFLLSRVLHHERRYWRNTAAALDLPSPHRDRLHAVAATATLFPTALPDQAHAVLSAVRTFHGQDTDTLDRYRQWWQDSHPGPGELNPLAPHLLGELHVAESAHLATAAVAAADDDQFLRALQTLARAAGHHDSVQQHLAGVVGGWPRRALPVACEVAARIEDPRPLLEVMTDVVSSLEDAETLAIVISALPTRTEALKDFAVLALERGLQAHTAAHADVDASVTAYLHGQLSIRLGDVGDYAAALDHNKAAEQVYRVLATERPDPFGFHLAIVLANGSVHLRRLDRTGEALIAVDEALGLLGSIPTGRSAMVAAYEAAALALKATHEAGVGDHAAAADTGGRAVAALRDGSQLPEAFGQRANLAFALHNQAVSLARIGDDTAAAVAAEGRAILGALAQEQPDAFLRPLIVSAGPLASTGSPLDHLMAGRGLRNALLSPEDVLRIMSGADLALADEFIDAVIRVCTPVWKDSSAPPPDELALRAGGWVLDLNDSDNRETLMLCAVAAKVNDVGGTMADVRWTAEVLRQIAAVDGAAAAPDATTVIWFSLRPEVLAVADGVDLHALLTPSLAAKTHPLDLADFVRGLMEIADGSGQLSVVLSAAVQ